MNVTRTVKGTFPDVDFLYSLQKIGFDLAYLIFAAPNVPKIQNLPVDVLSAISKMVRELEDKFGAGKLSDVQRLKISLMFVDHYLQTPSLKSLENLETLELLLNR